MIALSLLLAAVAWEDPAVNAINRLPPRTYSMPLAEEKAALTDALEPETPYALSLNGNWKFRWSGNPGLRPADFFRTEFDDADWYSIDVPSCAEMRGFGSPWYTNQKYPHANFSHPTNASFAAIRDRRKGTPDFNPVLSYRRTFSVPETWRGRRTILRFDGVYSAYYVWINGKEVGYAEDSTLPSEFDVTACLRQDAPNLLCVEVYKWCDGSYLEDQDMTRFSGIFRDVTLWSMPKDGIWDFAVRTSILTRGRRGAERIEGSLSVEGVEGDWSATLYDAGKTPVASLSNVSNVSNLSNPRLWSAEKPYLYTLVLRKGSDIRSKRIGFKEQKIDGSRLLVNGCAIKIKGVNRHESSPENGRTLTRAEMVRDVELMKRHNFNAVRTSHYPDHRLWYDLCDRYGIYVMAEANVEGHEPGFGENGLGRFKEWEHSIVERNLRQVEFYRNNPSVTFWSMGNETGHGEAFRRAISAVRAADPSRPVHWERGNRDADFDSSMYETVGWVELRGRYGDGTTDLFERGYADYQTAGRPFLLCEYSHAMGNSLGNLQEYWDVIYRHDSLMGGFIWDWIDQAVWKETDKLDPATGRRERYLSYGGDYDEAPNDGNFNCNGVVDPERHVTAKLIEAGHVQRNLVVTRMADGSIELWNRFAFTAADEFDGEWELLADGKTLSRGNFPVPALAPLSRCDITGLLPDVQGMANGREMFLNISFSLKCGTPWAERGWIVARNQVRLSEPAAAASFAAAVPKVTEGPRGITVECGGTRAVFSRAGGTLSSLTMNGCRVLGDPADGIVAGPRLTWMRSFTDNDVWLFKESAWHKGWGDLLPSGLTQSRYHVRSLVCDGNSVRSVVEITGTKSAGFVHEAVWTFGEGGAIRMDNVVTPFGAMPPAIPRLGLSLKLDSGLDDVRWYGRGPRENYIDRCTGSFFGVWNSSVDGLSEFYVRPQDNGYRCDVRWVSLSAKSGKGVRFRASEPMFVQAMKYGWEDLEFSRHRIDERRIRSRLVPDPWTNLNLDVRQLGLGSASCGNNPPLPQYRFPIERTTWTLWIEPEEPTKPILVSRSSQNSVSAL